MRTARIVPMAVGRAAVASPSVAAASSVAGMASAESTSVVTPADASTFRLGRSRRPKGAQ